MKDVRDLDGFFYRVKRGDKYANRCFSDLERKEQIEFLNSCKREGRIVILCEMLKLYEQFVVAFVDDEDELNDIILDAADRLYTLAEKHAIIGGVDEDD